MDSTRRIAPAGSEDSQMQRPRKQRTVVARKALPSKDKSLLLAQLMRDRKAQDVVVLDLTKLVSFTDYFVICTGRSDRQVQAIAEYLERELRG